MAKRILGIDPGSRATGYAIIEQHHTSYKVIKCSVLRMHKMDTHTERLQFIFDEISALIREYPPDECAIETPVHGAAPLALPNPGRA